MPPVARASGGVLAGPRCGPWTTALASVAYRDSRTASIARQLVTSFQPAARRSAYGIAPLPSGRTMHGVNRPFSMIASKTLTRSRLPSRSQKRYVPGQPSNARTLRRFLYGSSESLISPSSFAKNPQYVAAVWSCSRGAIRPSRYAGRVDARRRAPDSASRVSSSLPLGGHTQGTSS